MISAFQQPGPPVLVGVEQAHIGNRYRGIGEAEGGWSGAFWKWQKVADRAICSWEHSFNTAWKLTSTKEVSFPLRYCNK